MDVSKNLMKSIPPFHILCALLVLGVGLTSCAPMTAAPINVSTALTKPTEIVSTVVPTSTTAPSPTPETTPTPEAMTWEKWEKILYNGTFESEYTKRKAVPLEEVFGPTATRVLTKENLDEIKNIRLGSPIAVLHPSGIITTPATPEYAAEQVSMPETYVLVDVSSTNGNTADFVRFAIIAASNAYRNGQTNIRVEFGSMPQEQGYNPQPTRFKVSELYTISRGGHTSTPIIDMPATFLVGKDRSTMNTFQELGFGEPTEDNWLDIITKEGYVWIEYYPFDNHLILHPK
jgi:hypothetical protein